MYARIVAALLICLTSVSYAKGKRNPLNGHKDHNLDREGEAVNRFNLSRFADSIQLQRAIGQGLVKRVPDQGVGFRLDARLGERAGADERQLFHYARPWTLLFLARLGAQYAVRTGDAFRVSSLVRTCTYQRALARGNANATTCEKTSHTSGATADILVSSIAPRQRTWMRQLLGALEAQGVILATEEHVQPVFHVMVLPTFGQPAKPKPKHLACR